MKKLSILFTFSAFLLFGCLSCEGDSNQQEKEPTEKTSSSPIKAFSRAPHGTTSLHNESSSGDTNQVKLLLRIGFDANARNEYGRTPLHFVSGCCGNAEIAKLLIEAGADVNARDRGGKTPLHWAASFRKVGIVKVFIEAGAYVCAKDHPRKITPLRYAQNRLASAKRDSIQGKNKADWVIELRKKKLKNSEEIVNFLKQQ